MSEDRDPGRDGDVDSGEVVDSVADADSGEAVDSVADVDSGEVADRVADAGGLPDYGDLLAGDTHAGDTHAGETPASDRLAGDPVGPMAADGAAPDGDDQPDGSAACPCACGGGGRSFVADERGAVERRDYAKVLATLGGLAAVGSLSAPLVGLTRVFERKYTGPIFSDGVHLVDADGERVSTDRLQPGELLTVFPETHPGVDGAPTLLVRFATDEYAGETNAEWVVEGYAAYSKVCTHAGCMVSEQEDTTLVCPCHSGKFDPLQGASVVGGPPPRSLPQLPLSATDEGLLVATGDFEGHVGPGGE